MSAWKTRQPGYYWVNLPAEGGWQPAYWNVQDWREKMGHWSITDSEYELDDEDFAEIAEPCIRVKLENDFRDTLERNLNAQRDRLIAALTPSERTKYAYIGEVNTRSRDGRDFMEVDWTAIKEVMALIRKEAGCE